MKTIITFITTIILTLAFTGCGTSSNGLKEAPAKVVGPWYEANNEIDNNLMLSLVNLSRAEGAMCGEDYFAPTHALTLNKQLETSALVKAYDLAKSGNFSHYSSGTESDINGKVSVSFTNIKREYGVDYHSIGENIAGGWDDVHELHNAFMNSPGHCSNIMSPEYNEVGFAKQEGNFSKVDYAQYWVQHFGSKN